MRQDLRKLGVRLPLRIERFRYSERYWLIGWKRNIAIRGFPTAVPSYRACV